MRIQPIIGFPGYHVTDQGGVVSERTGRRRSLSVRCGKVQITGPDGIRVIKTVARLVLAAFVRPPRWNEIAVHRNGDKADCRVENLRWQWRAAPPPRRGENGNGARLTWAAVRDIRRRLDAGEQGKDVAVAFGISPATVSQIKHGQTWQEFV